VQRWVPPYAHVVHILALVVAAVTLASPFGSAEASAIFDEPGGLTVEISVEVSGTFSAVLVRPFSSYEELPPTALVSREDGRWSGYVVVPTAEDWSIVFDAIAPDGGEVRSDTSTLTELGVDPVVISAPPVAPVGRDGIGAGRFWLFGGIVLALGALGALAWWTFGGAPTEPDVSIGPANQLRTDVGEPSSGQPPEGGVGGPSDAN
jgi:hypothetical protein